MKKCYTVITKGILTLGDLYHAWSTFNPKSPVRFGHRLVLFLLCPNMCVVHVRGHSSARLRHLVCPQTVPEHRAPMRQFSLTKMAAKRQDFRGAVCWKFGQIKICKQMDTTRKNSFLVRNKLYLVKGAFG